MNGPKIITAPQAIPANLEDSVFLAGSIEMGEAEDWQAKAIIELGRMGYSILNPRREDWNKDWIQSIDNPYFYRQVVWELQAMEQADYILMHFVPDTKSPITLLELGLWAAQEDDKLTVSCPIGFWRRGNIEIVCEYYQVPLYHRLEDAIGSFHPGESLEEQTWRYLDTREKE